MCKHPRLPDLFALLTMLLVGSSILVAWVRCNSAEAVTRRCMRNVQVISAGLHEYVFTHDHRFPVREDFPGGSTWFAGGSLPGRPDTVDPARPLSAIIRDPRNFHCPFDRGSTALDAPANCFAAWGTSYLWAAEDARPVGLLGMLGRRWVDPMLSASSRKAMVFEPWLLAQPKDGRPADAWHGPSGGGVIAFLDGHAERVPGVAAALPDGESPLMLDRVIRENRPYY